MAIVRLDKVLSGTTGNLEHIVVFEADKKTTHKDYPNGLFVNVFGSDEKNREVRHAVVAEDSKKTKELFMISTPELQYDEKKKLDDFMNYEGKVSRGYRISDGDIFTHTEDIVDLTSVPIENVKQGMLAVVKNGKLSILDSTASGAIENLKSSEDIIFEVIENPTNELHIAKKAIAFMVHL